MAENKQMEEPIIPEVSKIEEKDQIAKKPKKILVIVVLVVVLLVSSVAAAYIYWKKVTSFQKTSQSQSNSNPVAANGKSEDKVAKLVLGESVFEDRSLQNPVDANLDSDPDDSLVPKKNLKLLFSAASKGMTLKAASQCEDLIPKKMEDYDIMKTLDMGVCVGGYAASAGDQAHCENYDFKAKYKLYSMCDDCGGMQRNFIDGNSAFESCYIGYGIVKKDEKACLNLSDVAERKNVPEYEDDKTSPQEIKKESCIYGAAIGKNNYDLCEFAGFFKDSCYYNFSLYRKSADLCEKTSNPQIKSRCILSLSRLANVLDKCMEIQPLQGGIAAYSNDENGNEMINQDTQDKDMCIENVVSTQKLTDKSICEKIVSRMYKNSCKRDVAVNSKDISLCNLNFLSSQSDVDSCIVGVAQGLEDVSLCKKSSEPDRCEKLYNNEPVPLRLEM